MTQPCATGCTRPAHDSMLCLACTAQLEQALAETPWLAEQLTLVTARLNRGGARTDGPRPSERPLPINLAASDAAAHLRAVTITWATTLGHRPTRPADTTAAARALLAHLHQLTAHPDAARAHTDLTTAHARATRTIDRPPDLICAGPCLVPDEAGDECGAYLYAHPGAATVECRTCGITHDVAERRDWMRAHVDQTLMTPAEVARWAAYLTLPGTGDHRRTAKLIATWIDRGRLTRHTHSHDGAPLVRFGEAVALLATSPRTRPTATTASA